MKHAPVRHRLELAAFLAVRGGLRALPHPAARRVGSALGALAARIDRRHLGVAQRNLALALPDLSPAARAATARACFRHFFAVFFDAVSAERLDAGELCRRTAVTGWEHLDAAEAEGRGVLVMGAHVGSWEIAAWTIGALRGPLHAVGRLADNPFFDRQLQRFRGRFGNVSLDKRGSVRRILRLLANGSRVGLLIDQRVQPREGILAPFFGRPAWTSPLLARLALRTGAPIVPVFGDLAPAGGYRVDFGAPILGAGDDDDEAVADLTARCLAAVEGAIRPHPERWLWMHDRWRGAPTG